MNRGQFRIPRKTAPWSKREKYSKELEKMKTNFDKNISDTLSFDKEEIIG